MRAAGNRTVGAGEGVQLPHGGGQVGEGVHHTQRGPGQNNTIYVDLFTLGAKCCDCELVDQWFPKWGPGTPRAT